MPGMQVINDGRMCFRTRAMEAAQAERFAQCIQANPRFERADVCKSNYTPSETKCWYVRYLPRSADRQAEMVADFIRTRLDRAIARAADYEFVRDDSARFFHVVNKQTGETHQCTERSCDCGDHHYRGRQLGGAPCLHMLCLVMGLSPIRGWSDAANPAQRAAGADHIETETGEELFG